VIHGVEHGHEHAAHGAHDHDAAANGHDEHANPAHPAETAPAFDAQDMRNMGGLRKRMPITFWTFLAGGLALAGFPFITAGFWSKDEILADAFHGLTQGSGISTLVFIVLALSALMTAFYTMRQISMTFLGEPRTEAAANASESVPTMTFPLIVLAVFAIFFGFVNVPPDFPVLGPLFGSAAGWLKNFTAAQLVELDAFKEQTLAFNAIPLLTSLVVALGGLGLGWLVYGQKPLRAGQTDPVEKLGGLFTFLHNRWYFDELYRTIFINPLQWIADNYTRIIDKGVIDWILEGVYKLGVVIAAGFKEFDRVVITGGSDLIGDTFRDIGREGRELQSGQVQNYLLSALIAAVVLMVFFLVFSQ
jgi:NADH-quinone oxidoreductase subunit L